MRLESKFLGPKLEQRGHRQRVYVCMYGERAGGRGEEEERSCPRRRRRRVLLLLLLLPSPLGAPERATDRSYASHPSMSSELLLSSVSLLSLPLPLSSPSSLSLSPAYTSSSVAATPHSDADRRNGRTKANAHTTS